jgi:signal transduction histidine kinase
MTSTLRNLLRESRQQVTVDRATVESTLESAETIMACVAHQKCIIDDVLTLSKLESGMLLVSPVEIQPVEEVRRALKLFDGELHNAAIDLQFDIGQSYQSLDVDWVLLDPTRLLQILINLLTNAIKCKQHAKLLFCIAQANEALGKSYEG